MKFVVMLLNGMLLRGAVFTNWRPKGRILSLGAESSVTVDLFDVSYVDRRPLSRHPLAARKKKRQMISA